MMSSFVEDRPGSSRRSRRLGLEKICHQPSCADVLARQQGRQEEAERRDEPEQADHDQQDLHRRLGEDAQDPRAPRLPRLAAPGRRSRRWPLASLLKRRMLSTRTGITSRKRKTAIAEPRPKSFAPVKAIRHIASAITFASSCDRRGRDRQHDVEDLEDVDDHRDEDDGEHRREQRHRDAAEDLPLVGAVGAGRLEQVAWDGGQAGARSPPSRSLPRPRCRRS